MLAYHAAVSKLASVLTVAETDGEAAFGDPNLHRSVENEESRTRRSAGHLQRVFVRGLPVYLEFRDTLVSPTEIQAVADPRSHRIKSLGLTVGFSDHCFI